MRASFYNPALSLRNLCGPLRLFGYMFGGLYRRGAEDRRDTQRDPEQRQRTSARSRFLFYLFQMAQAFKCLQIYICDAPHLCIVERQTTNNARLSSSLVEVDPAEITGILVDAESNFGATLRIRKLNSHVAFIESLLKAFH